MTKTSSSTTDMARMTLIVGLIAILKYSVSHCRYKIYRAWLLSFTLFIRKKITSHTYRVGKHKSWIHWFINYSIYLFWLRFDNNIKRTCMKIIRNMVSHWVISFSNAIILSLINKFEWFTVSFLLAFTAFIQYFKGIITTYLDKFATTWST